MKRLVPRKRFAIFIYLILTLFITPQAYAVPWDFEETISLTEANYPPITPGVSIFSFTITFDPGSFVRRDFSGGESYLIHVPLPAGVNGAQAAFQSNFADPLSGVGFYRDVKPEFCPANVTGGSPTPCGSGNYIYLDDGNGNRFEPVKGQASISIFDLRFEESLLQSQTTGYLALYLQPGSTSRYDSSAIGFSLSIGDTDLYEQWWCENISRQCDNVVTPTPSSYTLDLSATGNGVISVRNGSTEIGQCGSTASSVCSYTQPQGTTLSLVALPTNNGATVTWAGNSGQCNANGNTVQQNVSLSSNINCSVQFTEQAVETNALSIIASTQGVVTSTDGLIQCGGSNNACSTSYPVGQTVTLQATANSDFRFTGWTGTCSGTNSTVSLTMNQASTCQASFAAQTAQNTAPVAQFAHWFDAETSTVYLDASASYDDDNDSLTYQWHSSNKQTDFDNTSQKTNIGFSNITDTTQTITLVVSDGRGGFDSDSRVVELPRPITADFSLKYTNGQEIETTADSPNVYYAAGDLNVDLAATATSADNTPISSYQWSISNYAVLDENQPNLTISLQSQNFLYAITLLVTDQNGRTTSVSKLLQVASDSQSPLITNVVIQPTGTIDEQTGLLGVSLDAGETFDPDGGNLTYSWSSTGTCNNGQACSANEAQSYFVYDAEGTYSISLTVTDEEGQSSTLANQEVEVKRPVAEALVVNPLTFDADKNYYVAAYGEPLTIQVSAQSGVTQGTITKYTWSYRLNNGAKTIIGDTVTPSLLYSPTQAGEYFFLVDIEDNYNLIGGSGSGQVHVDLPAVGTGRSLKTRSLNNGLASANASFSASVIDTENNVLLGNQGITIKASDPVVVQFTIDVAEEDIGLAADIISVVEFKPAEVQQGQWYMKSQTDTFPYVAWNPEQDIASFTFSETSIGLKAQEQVIVAEGQFTGLVGDFKIFTGYRLKTEDDSESGEFTFNETPLQFSVEE